MRDFRQKIVDRGTLAALLLDREGRTVAFTNGCFDILHRGHVEYLAYARSLADLLVVGVNSDSSVRRLKGEERPINTERDRATVLAGLESVDYVTIFEEDTPLDLIRIVKPDLLVKGSDYTIENVVGAKEVVGWGGRVVLAPMIPGHSTTNLIRRTRDVSS